MAIAPDVAEFVIAKAEARRSSTLIQAAALLGAVICVALAASLQPAINTQRKQLQLVLQSNIYKELPPEYAWVSAAGSSFRSIMADILWARADRLKEEGKYYELNQLANWICTLQPRFPQVWSFQAWNMSYNISVATHTAQERWQWVYNGIRLLRDLGIPNNERAVGLYHQLAWIWFHKVGDRMDDFHESFKLAWISTMDTLLGAPPAAVSDAETIDWFRPVAEAPRRLSDVIAAHPGVAGLVDKLAAAGVDVNAGTDNKRVLHPLEETFFRKYRVFEQEQNLSALRKEAGPQSDEDRQLFEVFRTAPKADMQALLAWMRAKVLREQYKMDPLLMLAISGRLGTAKPIPIDWRTPWAQAIYWALYGVDRGRELNNAKEFDLMNTDRILLFSLATLAKGGRLVFVNNVNEPMRSFLNQLPDFRYIEAMHKKYLELGKVHAEDDEKVENTTSEMLRSGHVNNLQNAIVSLYLAGHVDEARKYLEYLALNYKNQYTKEYQDQYLQDIETFVRGEIKDMADSLNDVRYLIFSLLTNGYMSLAAGYADEYAAAVRNAALIYQTYQKDKVDDPQGRRTLPPFTRVRADALVGFVLNEDYPLTMRSAVWNREQLDVRQRAYDMVATTLAEQCDRGGLDVQKAFPEPRGMADWRKANPKIEDAKDALKKKPTGEAK